LHPYTADSLYNLQWSLQNTGQHGGTIGADIHINDAWGITKGCPNIRIAVIDEGVDLTHPDLINNLVAGYDETGRGSNGGPQGDDAHGTNVAGIIAAQENAFGIVGVAPQCRIIPIRIAFNIWDGHEWIWSTTDQQIANAIYHAWHDARADVLNNSWGGGSPSTTITNAINNAITGGRNAWGSLVVFAAGNTNSSVQYPATLANVIAVGASCMCDTRKRSSRDQGQCNPGVSADPDGVSCDGETWWGSSYGSELDIVAPGVFIPSTDLQAAAGYNQLAGIAGNYYLRFNGTSAATPHVSGVLALILSVNPNLNQAQVRQILETNADKINGYTFSTQSGHPNGTWNNQVGYGRLNAYKSLYAAAIGFISGPPLVCSSGSTYSVNYPFPVNTIVWKCSSNIIYQSAPTQTSAIFKTNSSIAGTGWITATITPCASITFPVFSVWEGKFESTVVTGQAAVCPNSLYPYTAQVPGGHSPSYSYSWTYPSGWYNNGQVQNMINLQTPQYNMQYGAVRVSITNCNGTSGYSGITVYPGSCPHNLTLSPNPASDIVNVMVTPAQTSNTDSTSTVNAFQSANILPTTYKVTITDLMGTSYFNATKNTTSFALPVQSLPNGNYIITVDDGVNKGSAQLVVKH
jgi:hypothetical protein